MRRPTTIELREGTLQQALAIIEREHARDLRLGEVAARLFSSERQLQRCFGESGCGSFRDRVTAARMRHAAELLTGGDLRVRDVAMAVGYRQPAQFAKSFRRAYGVAPTAYRATEHPRPEPEPEAAVPPPHRPPPCPPSAPPPSSRPTAPRPRARTPNFLLDAIAR